MAGLSEKKEIKSRSPTQLSGTRVPPLRFKARILRIGVNPFVWISAGGAGRLAPRRKGPIPVILRENGRPVEGWRVNAMPAGDGSFRLYLSGIVREASGTRVGDRVAVELSTDVHYRAGPAHPMPVALRNGLAGSRAASVAWTDLPPSLQKEVLRYIAALKSRDARRRNIALALEVLGGFRRRFLGRDWNASTRASRDRGRRRRMDPGGAPRSE